MMPARRPGTTRTRSSPIRDNSSVEVTPEEWFEELGYVVVHSVEGDGVHWVSLRSIANPDFTVARYGRGESREAAAERARQRWITEQIGRG